MSPDSCQCYPGFTDPDCGTELVCPDVSNCSGNGVCLSSTECLCYDGFTGTECETPICNGNCNGRGSCVSAYFCECEEGWIGADCGKPSCYQFKFCSGYKKTDTNKTDYLPYCACAQVNYHILQQIVVLCRSRAM